MRRTVLESVPATAAAVIIYAVAFFAIRYGLGPSEPAAVGLAMAVAFIPAARARLRFL